MISRRRWWWHTIRVRLTALYAGTFFLASAAIVTLIYLQLTQVLDRQLVFRTQYISPPGQASSAPTERPRGLEEMKGRTRIDMEEQLQRVRSDTLNRMLISSIAILGLGGVFAGVLGWVLAGQALQPLRQITATARRVADRNLRERISLTGPDDEIKDLADTIDSMLERLDQTFESQQRFIANASHELRTPLTINRTLIEVAAMEESHPSEGLRQLAATLLAVNHRHERLIDGLLTLASSEQRIVEPTPVDIAEIAAHVAGDMMQRASDAKLSIRTELRPAPTMGEPVLLERLAENLLENAVRYNLPGGGWVRVATETAGDRVELVVENPGSMVPAYDVPRLFEPFQRLSRSERRADPAGASITRGVGLGLSIVRSIARAHGGDVTATPRDQGGLVVRVNLPAILGMSDADEVSS